MTSPANAAADDEEEEEMLLLGAATGEEAIAVRVMEEVELAAAGWLLRRLTGRRAATGRRSVPPLRSLSTKKKH